MFKIITDFPIAIDSPDHINPLGTKKDDSRNVRFINKCNQWLFKRKRKPAYILDIGCAGGGCVEDFIKSGHNAIGIEGSDYSQKYKRASWGRIPESLFTADASRPFYFIYNGVTIKFDIIISFEVMEHIAKNRLYQYFKNIKNNLCGEGLFIGSFTSVKSRKFPEHHQTIMTRKGWIKFIKKLSWFRIIKLGWKKKDYLRYSNMSQNCIPISFVLRS